MEPFEEEAALELKRLSFTGRPSIAGVDEVGRGPLAGPVVASAVILPFPPPESAINGVTIKDSKKMTEKGREAARREILSYALSSTLGIVWPQEIDEINIHKASLLAMKRAVEALTVTPDYLLIDGIYTIDSLVPQRAIKRGDSRSISIGAASIIAKCCRDRIMKTYDSIYSGYNFGGHKGYPTEEHRGAIRESGVTPIHRLTFNGTSTGGGR